MKLVETLAKEGDKPDDRRNAQWKAAEPQRQNSDKANASASTWPFSSKVERGAHVYDSRFNG